MSRDRESAAITGDPEFRPEAALVLYAAIHLPDIDPALITAPLTSRLPQYLAPTAELEAASIITPICGRLSGELPILLRAETGQLNSLIANGRRQVIYTVGGPMWNAATRDHLSNCGSTVTLEPLADKESWSLYLPKLNDVLEVPGPKGRDCEIVFRRRYGNSVVLSIFGIGPEGTVGAAKNYYSQYLSHYARYLSKDFLQIVAVRHDGAPPQDFFSGTIDQW